MTPRLKEIYSKEIQPALKDSLGLKNIFMAPRIEKIVLNMGLGLDGACLLYTSPSPRDY